jgi:glycosyltransferase involved in cell wall biosynthesis
VVREYGVLVDPESEEAWADAIGRILDSPAAAQRMVQEGHVYAENFSWIRRAHEYAAVYQEAIKGRQT